MSDQYQDRLSERSSYDFIMEFKESVANLDDSTFEKLIDDLNEALDTFQFFGGFAIITLEGSLPFILARNTQIREDFDVVAKNIGNLQPEKFFNALSTKIQQDSLGHLKLDYFEIFLANLTDNIAIAFFVIDEHDEKIEIMQAICDEFTSKLEVTKLDGTVEDTPSRSSRQLEQKSSTQNRAPTPERTKTTGSEKLSKTSNPQKKDSNQTDNKRTTSGKQEESSSPNQRPESKDSLKSDLRNKLDRLKDD